MQCSHYNFRFFEPEFRHRIGKSSDAILNTTGHLCLGQQLALTVMMTTRESRP